MLATLSAVSLVMRPYEHHPRDLATLTHSPSSDSTVSFILCDIPFLTTGILSLAVFSFFLVLKRVNRVILCLHISAFLCFSAAIVDLVVVLSRRTPATSATPDTEPLLGLIIAREVMYAVAAGFRFLFFWFFVACPPKGDTPAKLGLHSGSWRRWGVIGSILQWVLFTAIFAVTTLQILYRVVTPFKKYDLLYVLEGTLEIVISSIFILKLLLNSYLARLDSLCIRPVWFSLLCYSPIIFALGISIVLGVGDVLSFLFTETVFGRFLQAVELYIVIVYILISAFVHLRHEKAVEMRPFREKRSSSFQGLPAVLSRESSFRIPPPRVSTPDLASALQNSAIPATADKASSGGRQQSFISSLSRISRISILANPHRMSKRPPLPLASSTEPSQADSWDQNDAEKGLASGGGLADEGEIALGRPSIDREENVIFKDPMYTSILREPTPSGIASSSGGTSSPPVQPLTNAFSARSSVAAFAVQPISDSPIERTGTPIYGLQGISFSAPTPLLSDNRSLADPRDYFDRSPRNSGISDLLRQQEELDKTITALGLSISPSIPSSAQSSSSVSESPDTPKPPSAAQSDFSLSHFPEPPWDRIDEGQLIIQSFSESGERAVQLMTQSDPHRSQMLSPFLSSPPGEASSMGPVERTMASPPTEISAGTASFQSLRSSTYLEPVAEYQRPPLDYQKSRALQTILETSTPSSASLDLRLDNASLPSQSLLLPPSTLSRATEQALRRPPLITPIANSATSGTPSSVLGLAARKIGLPRSPRPSAKRVDMSPMNPQDAFERPRPAPSPGPYSMPM